MAGNERRAGARSGRTPQALAEPGFYSEPQEVGQ